MMAGYCRNTKERVYLINEWYKLMRSVGYLYYIVRLAFLGSYFARPASVHYTKVQFHCVILGFRRSVNEA
jgi:hypothetical protein